MKFKKSKRAIEYIVIHCTATREDYPFAAEDIDRCHKAQGWDGIGYNYVIGLDGTLQEGRDVDKIPAHVKGYNRNSLGVVYVEGLDQDMKPKDTRTIEQKSMLWMLLDMLKKMYPNATIQGHRDFPGVRKECPCFDTKKEYAEIKVRE